jgi:hypothetical protein
VLKKAPIPETRVPGMATARYQSPRSLIESATSWEDDLNRAVGVRMRELGIPEDMIGLLSIPGMDEGRAFVRFPDTQIGGNLNPAVNPAWKPGIALDHGILDVAHPQMSRVPAWGQATTVLRDRADAAIVHEYIEATLAPPQGLTAPARVEWLHKQAIRRAPDTSLPITERAGEILRQYRNAEGLAP